MKPVAQIVAEVFDYYPSTVLRQQIDENEATITAAKDAKQAHSEPLKRRARLAAALRYSQYVESQGLTTQQGIEAIERALEQRKNAHD